MVESDSSSLKGKPWRAIDRSPYRKEVLGLISLGHSDNEVADQLNHWDDGASGFRFTGQQVRGFRNRYTDGGTWSIQEVYNRRQQLDLQALANKQMDHFKKAFDAASKLGDFRMLKFASQRLMEWWDRVSKVEGLVEQEGKVDINQTFVSVNVEAEAVKLALKEMFADRPGDWERFKKLTKEKMEIIETEGREKTDGANGSTKGS